MIPRPRWSTRKGRQRGQGLAGVVEGVMRSVIKWLVELGKKLMRAHRSRRQGRREGQEEGHGRGRRGRRATWPSAAVASRTRSTSTSTATTPRSGCKASTPMTVKNRSSTSANGLTVRWQAALLLDDRERDKASALLDKGQTPSDRRRRRRPTSSCGSTTPAAKAAASTAAAAPAADSAEATADAKVTQEEQSLASMMAQLYDLFESMPVTTSSTCARITPLGRLG